MADYPQIIKLPEAEKILKTPSRKLTLQEIHSAEFQNLLDGLFDSLAHAKEQTGYDGAGISAVQIGENLQVFYALDVNRDEYYEYINPELTFLGEAKDTRNEACLSIPNIEVPVERYKRIRIKYLDRDGKEHSANFSGMNARIIQHEYDHLQGILITDKLKNNKASESVDTQGAELVEV